MSIDSSKVDNVISNQYQWFKVNDIEVLTDFVFILEFIYDSDQESDPKKGLYVPPGAHLMMRLKKELISADVNDVFMRTDLRNYHKSEQRVEERTANDPETPLEYFSRPYTPFVFNCEELKFKILFRYEGGEMSQRMVRLKIGDRVEWKGFYGDFVYKRNMTSNLICISQGVALSTMVNIIQAILDDDLEETRIHLISCFKTQKEFLLKDILREFQHFWNFKLTLCLPYFHHSCKDIDSCNCMNHSRIFNEEILPSKLQINSLKSLVNNSSESIYLISGSEIFCKSISDMLKSLNIAVKNIHTF